MSTTTTSALDNISSVNMLEMLITKDPRWSWIVGAWEQSEDASHRDLARRVRAFRDDFLEKTAKLTLQVLGDISSPEDVAAYLAKAEAEGLAEVEPEPEPEPDGAC
jgi:hypothetical protein